MTTQAQRASLCVLPEKRRPYRSHRSIIGSLCHRWAIRPHQTVLESLCRWRELERAILTRARRLAATRRNGMKMRSSLIALVLFGVTTAANASPYVVTLDQVGSDVVETGSGSIDITGLAFGGTIITPSYLDPSAGDIFIGGNAARYYGLSGPSSFGSGGQTIPNSQSGDTVSLYAGFEVRVPFPYTSDSFLSDNATYDNATFATLGVTPGTYVWTWGNAADQSFTLEIGQTPLPAALPLFVSGLGVLGLLGWRRKRKAAGALAAFVLLGGTAAANASPYVVTLNEVGANVVATGNGSFDLTGLTFDANNNLTLYGIINAQIGEIVTGPGSEDVYVGGISGPSSFGISGAMVASSGSGDSVGVQDLGGALIVPQGYVSGTTLSDTSTYDSATFNSLGVTPGTYEWTWGGGAYQSFTLEIGQTPLPAALPLFLTGLGALGLLGWRRRRKPVTLSAPDATVNEQKRLNVLA